MNILDQLSDSDFFGPGTDIIVSLTAVLILLFAVNSNLHRQRMHSIKKEHQAHVEELLASYKEIGNRLKKIEKIPDSQKRLNEVIDINQILFQKLIQAKEEKVQAMQRLEDYLNAYKNFEKQSAETSQFFTGDLDLREVRKNQISIVNEIAKIYGTIPKERPNDTFVVSIDKKNREDIIVQNEVTTQVYTFGNHILFDMDQVELKTNGKKILRNIGDIFKERLKLIREIQIQGHADPQPSKKYASNLQLAANRAITVFHFFQNETGIDPTRNIMSVTSFGQYMPVQRTSYDRNYNHDQLAADNNTSQKRTRNRRIEIVLSYFFIQP